MQNPETMTTAEINLRIEELTDLDLDWLTGDQRAEFAALWEERQKRNIADARTYWTNYLKQDGWTRQLREGA